MKVKELIEALKEHDDELEVIIYAHCNSADISHVEKDSANVIAIMSND